MLRLRLHRNELPWRPTDAVLQAARNALGDLNRYTDGSVHRLLAERLAAYVGVPPERIVLAPGSEVLLREAVYLFSRTRKVITLSPSFLPTMRAVQQVAERLLRVRLTLPAMALDMELLESEIDGPTLLVFDNPNNPTGQLVLNRDQVTGLLEHGDVLLILDEAYFEFAGWTCADMVEGHPNLLVTRSMDKAFGLAGAGMGYAVAGDAFLQALEGLYTYLPQVSVHVALAALEHSGAAHERVQEIVRLRSDLLAGLQGMGAEVYPSRTNFLLVRSNHTDMIRELAARGIWVLDVTEQMPPGFLRVTVGTAAENEVLLAAWRELQQAAPIAGGISVMSIGEAAIAGVPGKEKHND